MSKFSKLVLTAGAVGVLGAAGSFGTFAAFTDGVSDGAVVQAGVVDIAPGAGFVLPDVTEMATTASDPAKWYDAGKLVIENKGNLPVKFKADANANYATGSLEEKLAKQMKVRVRVSPYIGWTEIGNLDALNDQAELAIPATTYKLAPGASTPMAEFQVQLTAAGDETVNSADNPLMGRAFTETISVVAVETAP